MIKKDPVFIQVKKKVVYCTIRLRASNFEFKKFQEAKCIGYTQREVIEHLILYNGLEFTIFDKNSEKSVTFPKDFLLKNKKKKKANEKAR